MQTIMPVDIHVDHEWSDGHLNGSFVKKSSSMCHRGATRPGVRMRTCSTTKIKTSKTKPVASFSQAILHPKTILPARSRTPSPNREPWVPPPGRSTKGQKLSWQSAKARLDIVPVHDDVDDEHSPAKAMTIEPSNELRDQIQTYEKRIHDLSENVEMLKERTRHCSDQANPLPSFSNHRSASADEHRSRRFIPKVAFSDDSSPSGTLACRRRARSTTPTRAPFDLNPDREQLLVSLSDSEIDVGRIAKQLSAVKDILTKLKLNEQPRALDIDQLSEQRRQLLHLIEQFEHSNKKLKEFLRHQYHLEAEHGILNEKADTLLTRLHELQNENGQIRRVLVERENDNINLQTELERVRTHAIGYDTMKSSLEHNRAHLQRELYAREGEINRLQCALRALERDLHRSRFQCDHLHRSIRRTPMFPVSACSCSSTGSAKNKDLLIEKLETQLDELQRKFYGKQNEHCVDANVELARLRTKLEHAERANAEYREQLHAHTLKASLNNSKTHASELELEKLRTRLQRRIEELEPLPELLRQVELKNQELQTRLLEQEKRLLDQSTYLAEWSAKTSVHNNSLDRSKESRYSIDDETRVLQQKIDSLQRQIIALEEDNATLARNLNGKEEALRNAQSRLHAKAHELMSVSKQIESSQTDLKTREDAFGSKERSFQQRTNELEQQVSRLRHEYNQLKRDKDDLERRYTSQLGELRDRLEQSNNNNRSMQNYVNSLKTTYATVFNDPLTPAPSARLMLPTSSIFP